MKTLQVSIVSTSISGKKDNGRSRMLKAVMPKLSGDQGKELAQAFEDEDGEKVGAIMHKIADELKEALINK